MLAACWPSPSTYPDISSRQESLSVCKLLRSADFWERVLRSKKKKKREKKKKESKGEGGQGTCGDSGRARHGKASCAVSGAPGMAAPREACGALQRSSTAPPFPCYRNNHIPRPSQASWEGEAQWSAGLLSCRHPGNCRRSPSVEGLATSVPHFLFLCLPSPTASISSPWPLPQSLLGGPCQQGPSPAAGTPMAGTTHSRDSCRHVPWTGTPDSTPTLGDRKLFV